MEALTGSELRLAKPSCLFALNAGVDSTLWQSLPEPRREVSDREKQSLHWNTAAMLHLPGLQGTAQLSHQQLPWPNSSFPGSTAHGTGCIVPQPYPYTRGLDNTGRGGEAPCPAALHPRDCLSQTPGTATNASCFLPYQSLCLASVTPYSLPCHTHSKRCYTYTHAHTC